MVGSRPPRRTLPGLPAHRELEEDPGTTSLLFWPAVWVCRLTSSPYSRPVPLPNHTRSPQDDAPAGPPSSGLLLLWWCGAGVGRSPLLEAGSRCDLAFQRHGYRSLRMLLCSHDGPRFPVRNGQTCQTLEERALRGRMGRAELGGTRVADVTVGPSEAQVGQVIKVPDGLCHFFSSAVPPRG